MSLKNNALTIAGKDTNGRPYTIFKKTSYEANNGKFVAKMGFQGYYNEPELNVHLPKEAFEANKVDIEMVYSPPGSHLRPRAESPIHNPELRAKY